MRACVLQSQDLEESVIGLRHELEEQQVANTAMEEELSDTQVCIHACIHNTTCDNDNTLPFLEPCSTW